VLYQLSYGVCNHFLIAGANIRRIIYFAREIYYKFDFFLQDILKRLIYKVLFGCKKLF